MRFYDYVAYCSCPRLRTTTQYSPLSLFLFCAMYACALAICFRFFFFFFLKCTFFLLLSRPLSSFVGRMTSWADIQCFSPNNITTSLLFPTRKRVDLLLAIQPNGRWVNRGKSSMGFVLLVNERLVIQCQSMRTHTHKTKKGKKSRGGTNGEKDKNVGLSARLQTVVSTFCFPHRSCTSPEADPLLLPLPSLFVFNVI